MKRRPASRVSDSFNRKRRRFRQLSIESLESRALLASNGPIGSESGITLPGTTLPGTTLPGNVAGQLTEFYRQEVSLAADSATVDDLGAPEPSAGLSQIPLTEILQFDSQNRPLVDIWTKDAPSAVLAGLHSLGIEVLTSDEQYHLIEAWLDASQLSAVAQLPGVLSLTPVYKPLASAGEVVTQGDEVMHTDDLRDGLQFPPSGYDGQGVRVGVLSDSADRIGGGLDSSQDTGDLPDDVYVIWDGLYGDWGDTDEGRAMLEIVHDVAPGAELYFTTASGGELAFARGIRELAEAGCSVIVDDVAYFTEPFFQDGIVAQAVSDVTEQWGVSYFSAAGNEADVSYESPYVDSNGEGPDNGFHDFDTGAGKDVFQQLRLPAIPEGYGRIFTLVLQWDQPFYTTDGVTSNFDVFLYSDGGLNVLASATTDNMATQQPLEVLQWYQDEDSDTTPQLAIQLARGNTDAQLKYVLFAADASIDEYATHSGTVVGHAAATGATAVGAVPYYDPTAAEPYSSLGPTTLYFDAAGTRLTVPEVRQKPDLVAPDNVNTTFFGQDIPEDADSYPNFAGTSAAAPHAAAAAAILKQVNPQLSAAQTRELLINSATDLGTAGWDRVYGYGLVDALAAFPLAAAVTDTVPPTASLIRPSGTIQAAVRALDVAYSERVTAEQAGDPASYDLRSPGPDGTYDTEDDVVYALTLSFDAQAHSARLKPAAGVTALPSGDYRLTVTGITDLSGHALPDGAQSFTFTVPCCSASS